MLSRSPEWGHVLTLHNHHIRFQIIEGVASGSLNFLSGLQVATLSTWSRTSLPPAILIGNTLVVSTLVSATVMATGAHINSIVTISTAFSGLCHPVRAAIYIFCQLVGGALGGSLLHATLGNEFAYRIHNGGCWIDPEGEVGIWQASLIEFTCAFVLLSAVFLLIGRSRSSTIVLPQVFGLRSRIGSLSG